MNDPDPLLSMLMRARPGELGPDVVAELLRAPEWHGRAACRGAGVDTAVFFPDKGESMEPARSFCSACAAAVECREAGESEYGVWGGTSQRQRTQARKLIRSSGRRPAPSADEAA